MIEGKLSLVLPAHNEDENIGQVIERAHQVLPRLAQSFEIIAVNDGSSDNTAAIIAQYAGRDSRVRLVHHEINQGYGAALRSGFTASTGDWVMIMDSDRQFDIADLVYLAPFTSQYDMVAGFRKQRNDPVHRTLFGKTFRLAMKVLFGVQLKDIDCAFKLMRGDLLRSLDLQSDGAMISTELMARWARAGGSLTQVGVHHYPRTAGQQSGGSLRVILRAMRDVPILWFRVHREHEPDPQAGSYEPRSAGLSPLSAVLIVMILGLLGLVTSRLVRRQ